LAADEVLRDDRPASPDAGHRPLVKNVTCPQDTRPTWRQSEKSTCLPVSKGLPIRLTPANSPNERTSHGQELQGEMTAKVPAIHFDTAVFPENERFERWRPAVAAYDVAMPEGADVRDFYGMADAWMLGDLVITHTRLSPMRFARSAEKAKTDTVDHYSFLLLKQGTWAGTVNGKMLTVGPGQVVAFDLTQPMDVAGSSSDSITIGIARSAIELAVSRMPDAHGAIFDGAMGRLLADHFLSLARELSDMDAVDVPTVTKATVGLITSCLAGLSAAQQPAEAADISATRHRIRRYIDQNLTESTLTPALICRNLNLSRSTLYRAFASSSGIAAYIRTRRLEAVHMLLNDPAEARSISMIAYDAGFVSDAHFSRVFRQQFGYTPSQARLGANRFSEIASAVDTESMPALFQEWMKEIG
jgi:AraC-like DNA-binding protein